MNQVHDAAAARTQGMKINRVFSKEGVSPYDEIKWVKRRAEIKNPDGSVVFEQDGVEFPESWSQLSVNVVSQKYFRGDKDKKSGPSGGGRESSVKQLVGRVAGAITHWGNKDGYFASQEDAEVFLDELSWLLLNQYGAFNSPVWFNLGLHHAYGWNGSADNYRWDHASGKAVQCEDSYKYPQISACFIQGVEDSMAGIMELARSEAMLFKNGSGTGSCLSTLRSSREKLSAGGKPSGPVSFMKAYDAIAGVIKSGGAVRRSAKMNTLKVWHPDILEFVECKAKEERKAQALIKQGYPADYNGEAYSTVAFQNVNISVRASDAFLKAVEANSMWTTKSVTDGSPVETMPASSIMDRMAQCAWECGDPGIQYHDTIQDWHTCPNSGEVASSNPCCIPGDTLIAVADGRNAVPIRELVGQEVNVYSWSHASKRVVISKMNNISVKRRDAKVYRVTLDDGSSFRSTDDHLIMLKDGSYKQAKDLRAGDSLNPFHSKVLERGKNRTLRRFVHTGRGWRIQYRWIWEDANGKNSEGYHIHHKDLNSLNDSLDNMVLLTEAEHIEIHRGSMLGDNNPARRCMTDEWRAKLSAATSGEKNPNFGKTHSEDTRNKMKEAAANRWASKEQREKAVETAKARAAKMRAEGKKFGAKAGPRYEKCCPVCRNNFVTPREVQIFCSNDCRFSKVGAAMTGRKIGDAQKGRKLPQDRIDKIKASRFTEARPEDKRKAAGASLRSRCLKAARLLMDYGHDFSLDSWDSLKPLAKSLGAKHFPARESVSRFFASDSEFRENASLYNHKVVSVEYDGIEDVYDGTVDGNHNFGIITSQAPSVAGAENPDYSGCFIHNSEYMHVNDSACNLASINLMKFRRPDGTFDVRRFRSACRVFILAQDILVDRASYPTAKIAENSHKFRQLGLGYCNLGGLLMSLGVPYDSEEGRAIAAGITAIMTGEAYLTSSLNASERGPFEAYELNREPMLRVMRKHKDAVEDIAAGSSLSAHLKNQARIVWSECLESGEVHGYRNAQATVIAPTGTIAFLMDADTTGLEPDIALVKYKKLAGGGTLRIVNQLVPLALDTLGYPETAYGGSTHVNGKWRATIGEIVAYIDDNDTLDGCPGFNPEHLPVFDCAFSTSPGGRSIHWRGHIKMLAAVQPFISGSMSKTTNLPADATPEDIKGVYMEGWKLGLKCVAVYRDGCKQSQPLNTSADDKKDHPAAESPKPSRERLPDTRKAVNHKFSVGGHEGYLSVGLYDDGRPGELFITASKAGSTIGGLLDTIATQTSIALQSGIPLADLVSKFSGQRFEPSGITRNQSIPFATSIVDYVFRWLGMEFLPGYREANAQHREDGPQEAAKSPDAPRAVPQADGPPCGTCGTLTVRAGACYRCPNCGSTTGCG